MKENKEKREFAQQLEQIAETLTQAVKDNEGRAFSLSARTLRTIRTAKARMCRA